MGAYAEYRWLRADILSHALNRLVEFHDIGETHAIHFQRMTEVTFPARTIDLGGFACGLKFGFSFWGKREKRARGDSNTRPADS